MKRIVLIAIPVILAIIVFVPISNRILYWSLFGLIFILVYLFHIMEDVVPMKDIEKSLNAKDFFSLKCGYVEIKGDKALLLKGVMAIYSGTILFYVREKATGGAKLIQTIPSESIDTYTLGKVDDYHAGITFTLTGGEEVKFTSKDFAKVENSLRTAIGWPEEGKMKPEG